MNTNIDEMTNSELIALLAEQMDEFEAAVAALDAAVDEVLESFDDE